MGYTDELYRSLAPLMAVIYIVIVLFNYFALTWPKRKTSEKAMDKLHNSFINIFMIEFWYWLMNPVIMICRKLNVKPNHITLVSLFLSVLAGYYFFAGNIGFAGWLLLITGTLDLVDGRLARETGKVTIAGAYLDSCSDRYADGFIFLGLALFFAGNSFDSSTGVYVVEPLYFYMILFSVLAIIGSEVMSYVKARGEAVGFTTKRGLMQRGERISMLTFFAILDPLWRVIASERGWMGDGLIIAVVFLMSILINISAIVRFVALFNIINAAEKNK